MSWLTDKAEAKVSPDWTGELHDANCRFQDITFDPTAAVLSIRCWRPVGWASGRHVMWEELLIVFAGLTCAPTITQEEVLAYYELSTVYFDSNAGRVCICFHAGLSIEYPASAPSFSYRGPTGQRRPRREVFP